MFQHALAVIASIATMSGVVYAVNQNSGNQASIDQSNSINAGNGQCSHYGGGGDHNASGNHQSNHASHLSIDQHASHTGDNNNKD